MEKRIQEARNCIDNGLYEAALALALTLPDICGQVEYPALKKVGERYTKWIDDFVDSKVLYDQFFDEVDDFKHLESEDIYKLRCAFYIVETKIFRAIQLIVSTWLDRMD